ncbi:glycosyltransferase family 39 protein [Microlunatus elymi]|uniref:glycosyltransferase family 39 protein n=1 Tax=Microlunatus elymi TaxID=2596828 RepID=UPI001AEF4BB3|nr:glycosyltransferase family 39 protein [Microlunatus elymi]
MLTVLRSGSVGQANQSAESGKRSPVGLDRALVGPVLLFHVLTRGVVIVGLWLAAKWSGRSFAAVATRWDGRWYLRLAANGYPSQLPMQAGQIRPSTAAFFPFFPWLTRPLMSIGVPFWLAAMVLNLLASSAAVVVIVLVSNEYLDRRSAQLLGCLWTAFPVSAVLSTTYSEAVFTLLGALCLLFVLRRRWILAGLAAALAGATRPPGIVFAGAVGVAAIVAVVRRREWRSLIGAAIAPVGFIAAVGYIGWRVGRLDGWQATEHGGWHSRLTFGRGWLSWLNPSFWTTRTEIHFLIAVLAVVLIALSIAALALRPPLPIAALIVAGAFLAFAFGGVEMDSAPRVMMAFFPVLAPLAVLLSRGPRAVRWPILGLGSVLAAVVGGYYFAFAPISP